jgi:two-component system response regulator NreC
MNILLAEDHNIVRNGIKMLLETENSFKVVGEAANGIEVLEKIKTTSHIDMLLTDINMPGIDGISLIKEALAINPTLKIAMLSMHDNEKYVHQAFMEGASGYLLKNVSAEELIFSLKHIQNGGKYLCAELTMAMLDTMIYHKQYQYSKQVLAIDFSQREIEILQLIAEGLTNSEMSDKLFISKRTIEGHRQSLLEKTESKNTATLIRFAVVNGIIQ